MYIKLWLLLFILHLRGGDGISGGSAFNQYIWSLRRKIIIRDNGNLGTGIHQGALIETQPVNGGQLFFQDGERLDGSHFTTC